MIATNIPIIFQMFLGLFVGIYLNNVNPAFSSMNDLLTYYFFSNMINIFQRHNPVYKVEEAVLSGSINIHLVKPYNFILYIIIKDYASKLWKLIIDILIVFPLLFFIYGMDLNIFIILRALLAVPLAALFIALNNSIFCYLAIVFERIKRIGNVYGMLSYFIGGGFVSAAYFPSVIKLLPQYFFFGAPLDFIITGNLGNFWLFILYLALFIALNYVIHKKVMRRIETNG
jgi:ABC-type uncharacterized transport system permease subunit